MSRLNVACPSEILGIIFSQLSLTDRLSATRTCKAWNQALKFPKARLLLATDDKGSKTQVKVLAVSFVFKSWNGAATLLVSAPQIARFCGQLIAVDDASYGNRSDRRQSAAWQSACYAADRCLDSGASSG